MCVSFWPTAKLKLDRDFSKYNYLSLDSATVNGLDDAASFRTVRVGHYHTHSLTLIPVCHCTFWFN
jgi:hypothetical protein